MRGELHRRARHLPNAHHYLHLVALERGQMPKLELARRDEHEAHPQAHVQRAKDDGEARIRKAGAHDHLMAIALACNHLMAIALACNHAVT